MGHFKKTIQDVFKKKPGRRFLYAYLKINALINHNRLLKLLFALIGSIILLIGIILLFIPGPGIPLVIIGALLCCIVSKKFAYQLDKMEKKGHKLKDRWAKNKQNKKSVDS